MEDYIGVIATGLIVSGIIGMVVMYGLVNSLKSHLKALGGEIAIMRDTFKLVVTEKECDRRHEGIDKDLNNLGALIRDK